MRMTSTTPRTSPSTGRCARPTPCGAPSTGLERLSLAVERPIVRWVRSPQWNPLYHTGTITLFALLIILVTGIYLTLFFQFGFDEILSGRGQDGGQPAGTLHARPAPLRLGAGCGCRPAARLAHLLHGSLPRAALAGLDQRRRPGGLPMGRGPDRLLADLRRTGPALQPGADRPAGRLGRRRGLPQPLHADRGRGRRLAVRLGRADRPPGAVGAHRPLLRTSTSSG